jgi:hypothetical protein
MHLFLLLSISCSKVIVCTYLINILSVSYLCVPFSRLFWRWRSFAFVWPVTDRIDVITFLPFQLPNPLPYPPTFFHSPQRNAQPHSQLPYVFNSTQRNSRGSHEPLGMPVYHDGRQRRNCVNKINETYKVFGDHLPDLVTYRCWTCRSNFRHRTGNTCASGGHASKVLFSDNHMQSQYFSSGTVLGKLVLHHLAQ